MANNTINLTKELYKYMLDVSLREHPQLKELREVTKQHRYHEMQISPEQGQFMSLISTIIGTKKALEVGVYTGYSSLAIALGLPKDGCLISCDLSREFTNIGKPFWEKAGVIDKIDLRLAPTINTLDSLIRDGQENTFDFAFIDADKVSYDAYYERCLSLLREGGVMLIDNVLWQGRVLLSEDDAETLSIQKLNSKLHNDQRIDLSLLPIGDGLTLIHKR